VDKLAREARKDFLARLRPVAKQGRAAASVL